MTMLAETPVPARSAGSPTVRPDASERIAQRVRAEFLEMPGLKLTLAQAAKVFGAEPTVLKPVLEGLREEGFLTRGPGNAFRRCTALDERVAPGRPAEDLLDAIGIELPCVVCRESYRVSLRKIQLSQAMMEDGCSVRHFADCPPAALFRLIDPATISAFEAAVRRIGTEADDLGGRLALRNDLPPELTRRLADGQFVPASL